MTQKFPSGLVAPANAGGCHVKGSAARAFHYQNQGAGGFSMARGEQLPAHKTPTPAPTFFATRSYDPTVRERNMMVLIDAGADVPDPMDAMTISNLAKMAFVAVCIGLAVGMIFAMEGGQ